MIFFPEPFGDELSAGKIVLMVLTNALLVIWLMVPIVDRSSHRALHDRIAGTGVFPMTASSAGHSQ